MALPKFIITMDGVFRLGMVNQHKDLLKLAINASVAIIISTIPPTASCSTGNPTTLAVPSGICSIRRKFRQSIVGYDLSIPTMTVFTMISMSARN